MRIARQEGEEYGAPLQKEEVWSKVGHTEKARQVLGNELIRALDAPLAAHLNDEGNDEQGDKSQSAQALKDRHSLQADLTGKYSCLLTSLQRSISFVEFLGMLQRLYATA